MVPENKFSLGIHPNIVQMLVNIPVGLFGLYFVDFIGLKKSFWIGTAFNVIGTGFRLGGVICDGIYIHTHSIVSFLIRYWIWDIGLLSVYNPNRGTIFHDGSDSQNCAYNKTDVEFTNWFCPSPKWGYPVALFGMAINSIPNAVRAGLPTKITALWFKPNEYDIANSLTSAADAFGTMIICIIAPLIVKEPSDLLRYQVYFAIPVFLSFIGSLFIRQEGYNKDVNKQSFKELVVINSDSLLSDSLLSDPSRSRGH